jgi:hypothetical protein
MTNLRLTLAWQGLSERRLEIEEMFVPSTMRDIPLSEGERV